jgi:hypothetical protein
MKIDAVIRRWRVSPIRVSLTPFEQEIIMAGTKTRATGSIPPIPGISSRLWAISRARRRGSGARQRRLTAADFIVTTHRRGPPVCDCAA